MNIILFGILLVALGLVFLVGIWFSRHHHAQITDTIGSLHHKVDAIQSAVDQIKKV